MLTFINKKLVDINLWLLILHPLFHFWRHLCKSLGDFSNIRKLHPLVSELCPSNTWYFEINTISLVWLKIDFFLKAKCQSLVKCRSFSLNISKGRLQNTQVSKAEAPGFEMQELNGINVRKQRLCKHLKDTHAHQ